MDKLTSIASVSSAPLLQVKHLNCIRQERVLFENLHFSLQRGELLQIRGKNGAGKSSLLRLLTNLGEADEGQILWHGHLLTTVAAEYAASLCYIGHHSGIHEQLTALENLAFWRAALQLKVADDFAILGRLGLAGLEDVPCRMLSAGQQRRVSLARLWLTDASLWILDEPFTALDQSAITFLQQHLLQHLQAGGAIILTTHQPLTLQYHALRSVELEYRW